MKYVVTLSLGPVQEFIAAARKTADLWAGSHLLVELAKVVAVALEAAGAVLIFPARDANGELTDGPNKILAELEAADAAAVADMARAACEAPRAELRRRWRAARERLTPDQRVLLDSDLAERQIDAFLETYAAWAPVENGDYARARRSVERLLAGRKALRDFPPAPQARVPRPKSPLDPAFDFVFDLPASKEGANKAWEALTAAPLRLKSTETLDAISLLKRIDGAEQGGRVPDTDTLARRASNHSAQKVEEDVGNDETLSPPKFPYFAILVADGDRMGERIEKQDSPDAHRELSRRLAEFATTAAEIIKSHNGFCVYAGGDDVLAFLPLPQAISCARDLAGSFTQVVGEGATLSVGVALVHYLDPLRVSLERAHAAERVAKNCRNSLAVALHTRGGGHADAVAAQWATEADDWERWVNAFTAESITRGVAHELHVLANEWPEWQDSSDEPSIIAPERLWAEAQRICNRKEIKADLPGYAAASSEALRVFAQKLIIARFLTGRKGVG